MSDKTNMFEVTSLVKDALRAHLKEMVYQQLMTEVIKDFTDRVEPVVKEAVDRVTLHSIESMKDAMSFRDELKVSVLWKDV